MDVLTIILIVLLVGVTIGLVGAPLWQPAASAATTADVERPGQSLEELEAQYRATLAAIKDLNFDYEMGKVSTEDYQPLLAKSKLEAARIRQAIDHLSNAEIAEQAQALDAEIETLVAQLRQGPEPDEALVHDVDAEIEALKTLPARLPATEGSVCPHCGAALRADDKFCSSCGQAVPEPAADLADHCPHCGYTYESGDAFCAHCGTPLTEAAIQNYENAKI
ncbi:MAG: zinc ribbon domain-containing protein [Anaerolineae bacterium]|nr:zinc ribbon domain-containing protein [Anaerolineae bacterium]MCB9105117.1 zinc ribbon domain-containing protein [Anaerolineales bacterium]